METAQLSCFAIPTTRRKPKMGQSQTNKRRRSLAQIRPDVRDLAAKAQLHEREVLEWEREFHRLCASGCLTREDFRSVYTAIFPCEDAIQFADHVFRAFDSDRSGSIDFREFMTALSIASNGGTEEKLKWAFSIYDTHSNGAVTKDEMLHMFNIIHNMALSIDSEPPGGNLSAQQRVNKIFEKFDKNQDGKLTVEEFVQGAAKDPEVVRIFSLPPSITDRRRSSTQQMQGTSTETE